MFDLLSEVLYALPNEKKDERLHFRVAWTNINHFSWPYQTFIINVWAQCEVTQCQFNTPLTGSYTSILPSWDLSLMYTKIAWFSIDWAFVIQKLKNWLLFIWWVPVFIHLEQYDLLSVYPEASQLVWKMSFAWKMVVSCELLLLLADIQRFYLCELSTRLTLPALPYPLGGGRSWGVG